jgi:peptidoglycan hydrolase-like protein with peptidoglycan-binding domain
MYGQLNFMPEPFRESAGESETEEFVTVRDHRGVPQVRGFVRPGFPGSGGGRVFGRGFGFNRPFMFNRPSMFNRGFRFGGFGGPQFRFGRQFGFGPQFRRGGFGFPFGRFGRFRHHRWPWMQGSDFGLDTGDQQPEMVTWAQSCLSQIIGDWVPQDGRLDHKTRRAIRMFQMQQQLPATGDLDEQTYSALQQACSGQSGGQGDAGTQGTQGT